MANREDEIVWVQWVRTLATTIVAVSGALGVLYSAFIFVVEPRAIEWTTEIANRAVSDVRDGLDRSMQNLERLDMLVQNLESSLSRFEEQAVLDVAPAWEFAEEQTEISDGEIGGTVVIKSAGLKLRECGIPVIDLYFVNGSGVFHRFVDASILTTDGRGVAFPTTNEQMQLVNYTARIPENDDVTVGRALGYIAVSFPGACPQVPPTVSGPLQFRITD